MLNLNNVYNHYSTQMVAQWTNRKSNTQKAQKKDDLKSVYNNMVRQNQHSPFYKFTLSDNNQAYAIGIKEAAMLLSAQGDSLSFENDNLFRQMTAVSDNENIVYASLNDKSPKNIPETLSVQVDSLATGQTNVGTYLPSGENSFSPGEYTFHISVGRNEFAFQLTIHKEDTNLQIQKNLANSINEHNIGVYANIRSQRTTGSSALVIRSEAVGLPKDEDLFFHFNETYLDNDISSSLGIENVEVAPSNAQFYINDNYHTSISNRISLNQSVELDLLSASDTPVTIRLELDEEKVTDKLKDFTDSYNQLVDIARKSTSQRGATKLFRDITGIVQRHKNDLDAAGLTIDESGYLQISETINSSEIQKLFDDNLSDFHKDIKRTTEGMILNPLNYLDKIVVTYPNTQGTYPNPYNPSHYSGLLFNDYA